MRVLSGAEGKSHGHGSEGLTCQRCGGEEGRGQVPAVRLSRPAWDRKKNSPVGRGGADLALLRFGVRVKGEAKGARR